MFFAKGVGGFRAEFFVLKREAYIYTSSEENGKSKQKFKSNGENRRFSTLISLRKRNGARKSMPYGFIKTFLFAFMPKCVSPFVLSYV